MIRCGYNDDDLKNISIKDLLPEPSRLQTAEYVEHCHVEQILTLELSGLRPVSFPRCNVAARWMMCPYLFFCGGENKKTLPTKWAARLWDGEKVSVCNEGFIEMEEGFKAAKITNTASAFREVTRSCNCGKNRKVGCTSEFLEGNKAYHITAT